MLPVLLHGLVMVIEHILLLLHGMDEAAASAMLQVTANVFVQAVAAPRRLDSVWREHTDA